MDIRNGLHRQRCKGTRASGFRLGHSLESVSSGRDAAIANYKVYLAKSGDLQGRLRGTEAFGLRQRRAAAQIRGWSSREKPPLRVHREGEWRDIVDGCGLCSPGKGQISHRRFPDSEAVRSPRRALVDSVEKFEQDIATRSGWT